jgi:hypothetical protein
VLVWHQFKNQLQIFMFCKIIIPPQPCIC